MTTNDDPDFEIIPGEQSSEGQSGAPAASDQGDFEIVPGDSAEPPHHPHAAAPPRQRAPVVDPADNEDDISFMDALRSAGKNIGPSSMRVLKDTAHGIMHPIDTLSAIGDAGKGLVSQAAGAMGVQQDPDEKARDERVIRALEHHYGQTYGNWKGFKHALAEDPASIAMDLSTVAGGGLGAAAKVAGEGSTIGKIAGAASRAASYANPVGAALGVGELGAKGAAAALRVPAAAASNVPYSLLKLAEEAGGTSDPAKRAAFWRHATGRGDAQEVLDEARNALENAKDSQLKAYLKDKNGMAAAQATPDMTNIVNTLDAMPKEMHGGNAMFAPEMANGQPTGRFTIVDPSHPQGRVPLGAFNRQTQLLQDIKGLVNDYAQNPARQNFIDLDRLKQQIYDKVREHQLPDDRYGMGVHKAVSQELNRIAPGYSDLMENWQNGLNQVKNWQKGLGLNGDSLRALQKMLKAQKSPAGAQLSSTLAEHSPTLPYMLAGQSIRPNYTSGFSRIIDLAAAGLAAQMMHWSAAGSAALGSPRLMGAMQYGSGMAQRGMRNLRNSAAPYALFAANRYANGPTGDEASGDGVPRGLRNNNAGNIIDSEYARKQDGYDGADEAGYARFKTPQHGDAAAVKLLGVYGRTGRDTIRKIAESWTPRGANPDDVVDGKIQAMSRALGINPDQRLAMSDPDLRRRLYDAIKLTEIGQPRRARAAGGRTGINHRHEAVKLVAMAESGLKHQNKKTEPLLELHDDTVARALKAADRYI